MARSQVDRDVAAIVGARDLGAQLRKMREISGLTREQVAVYMGKSVSTLVRWETNQKVPTILEAKRFALVLKEGGPIPGFLNSPDDVDLSIPLLVDSAA